MNAERLFSKSHRWRPLVAGLVGATAVVLVIVGLVVMADDRDSETEDAVTRGEGQAAASDENAAAEFQSLAVDGTSWVLQSGMGPEGEVPAVDGYAIMLNFRTDSLGGDTGCNRYGSIYELDGSNLTIEELSATAIDCEPPLLTAEDAYFAALAEVADLRLVGELMVLSGPSSALTFTPQVGVPIAELVGQPWLLDTLLEGEAASTVMGDPAGLLLDADHTFVAGTGCRSLTGNYSVRGRIADFRSLGAEGGCPAELSDQDRQVRGIFERGFTAAVDGDRLTITAQGGSGLSFRAVDELPNTPAIIAPTDRELDLLDAFVTLAKAGGPVDAPAPGIFAVEVGLGLGEESVFRLTNAQLSDPANWFIDRETFHGYVGPFSALELLAPDRLLTFTAGPHDHCSSSPVRAPGEFTNSRRVSIQPTDATSCLEWFTVDLFLNDAGLVEGVTLDLFEP